MNDLKISIIYSLTEFKYENNTSIQNIIIYKYTNDKLTLKKVFNKTHLDKICQIHIIYE